MLWMAIVFPLLGVGVLGVALVSYGAYRWRSGARDIQARLTAAAVPPEASRYSAQDLAGLPAPVQRYFRAALADGQPTISAVAVEHAGTFNVSETGEQWLPFTSRQTVVTRRPGFDWEAQIKMLPGLSVRGRDAYVAGEGILYVTLLGLLPLVHLRGTPEVAQGELMRFFAEAAWYPTALLPSQGVRWEAVDDSSAKATMVDGGTKVTMAFHFDDRGLLGSIQAESRGRKVAGMVIPTPWECRLSEYEMRDGMCIPLGSEVAWILPEGRKPYWRGRIIDLAYEFAK